jgi:hypothetical protein
MQREIFLLSKSVQIYSEPYSTTPHLFSCAPQKISLSNIPQNISQYLIRMTQSNSYFFLLTWRYNFLIFILLYESK